MPSKKVAILAYDACMAMEIFGISDTLLLANRIALAYAPPDAAPLFDVSVISLTGGNITAAGGFTIGSCKPKGKIDLLIVPGMDVCDGRTCLQGAPHLADEIAYIGHSFAKGTAIGAVCIGAFLVAEAGLLDGRRATTSWLFAADFAKRFPASIVDGSAMVVEDDGVMTTGSFAATFDLALHLIRQVASPKVARAVAKITLLEPQRVSQAAFIDVALIAQPTENFSHQVQTWLEKKLTENYNLTKLAEAFHVSGRTMLRRFKEETGITPLTHLQNARIHQAKIYLESTKLSVEQITEKVGYSDIGTFSALFKRMIQLTPAQYRRLFKVAKIS